MAPLKSHCLNKNEFVTCFVTPTTEAIYIVFSVLCMSPCGIFYFLFSWLAIVIIMVLVQLPVIAKYCIKK